MTYLTILLRIRISSHLLNQRGSPDKKWKGFLMLYSKTSISKVLESYESNTFEQLGIQVFLDTNLETYMAFEIWFTIAVIYMISIMTLSIRTAHVKKRYDMSSEVSHELSLNTFKKKRKTLHKWHYKKYMITVYIKRMKLNQRQLHIKQRI